MAGATRDVQTTLQDVMRRCANTKLAPPLADLLARAGDESPGSADAWDALREAALLIARSNQDVPDRARTLTAALKPWVGRPFRRWDEVVWALDVAAARPRRARPLLRTLLVSVRLAVRGEAPQLGNLGAWGDATHELLPQITSRLAALFPKRETIGVVLFRQLVKSLPHLGAEGNELNEVRSAAEYIHWLLECPLTQHIREEIHSKAAPSNLVLVRAYRRYLEEGDSSPLADLWLSQKIPGHDRALAKAGDSDQRRKKLIDSARELEGLLTRIYAFDPGDVHSVGADVLLWLRASGLDGESEIATQVRWAVEAAAAGKPAQAAEDLTAARLALEGEIPSRQPRQALRLLYLDLELEKLGYLLFGRLVHDELAEITTDNLPLVVDVLRRLVLGASLKGQGTAKLRWLVRWLRDLGEGDTDHLARLLVVNHHINDEISEVSLTVFRHYHRIVRSILAECGAGQVEVAVNKFIDGLIRDTTLQHLGELSMRVHHFALERLEALGVRNVRLRVDGLDRKLGAEASRLLAEAGRAHTGAGLWVFRFAPGQVRHDQRDRAVLGGKGASLCEMADLGLPVPPGFTVSVQACRRYMTRHALEPSVLEEIRQALAWLAETTGQTLGDPARPLLVSVRSGAPASMPGMLDTILNVGLTDEIAHGLGERTGESIAAAWYLALLGGYARTVLSLSDLGEPAAAEPSWQDVARLQDRILAAGAEPFWQDAQAQVLAAIEAVFRSWNNPHAILFRRTHRMPQIGSTAATVQQMVFGNLDENSCTGVVFSRNPSTGEGALFGEYLPRAQGEDLVSGRRTPLPVMPPSQQSGPSLQERMPEIVADLKDIARRLEKHYGDMQDIEFTVESGRLYLLQTRRGARTPEADHRIAADLGIERAEPKQAPAVTSAAEADQEYRIVARGLGASPGGAAGRVALSTEAARRLADRGEAAILVRPTTTPEELPGMMAADGVLTREGGATSHAANNARYLGKPCVVGCRRMTIDEQGRTVQFGDLVLHEGDVLFLDGLSGEVGVPIPSKEK